MRPSRPIPLSPAEQKFRLDKWLSKHATIEEKSGPEWTIQCPQCGRDKLAVHVARKAWQCWTCKFRGWRPSVLVAAVLGVSVEQGELAIQATTLGQEIGPVSALEDPSRVYRSPFRLPAASLPRGLQWGLLPPQAAYLASRGVPAEYAALLGAGSVSATGDGTKADWALADRVLFPLWSPGGRMVFWVARAIRGDRVKTINMPRACRDLDHPDHCTCYHEEWGLPPIPGAASGDEVVLGLHLVTPGEPVIVVEGPIDVAVCGPGFVAVLKSRVSVAQAALIAGTGASEAIILFDGDEPGWVGAQKSQRILSAAMPTRVAVCPTGQDPGSIGREGSLALAWGAPGVKPILPLTSPRKSVGKIALSPPFLPALGEK